MPSTQRPCTAGPASSHLRLQPGTRIGRYELVRLIGQGGRGLVYEAVHESLKRRVALKFLRVLTTRTSHADSAFARVLREGRAAARVRHPHVVDVFDCGVHEEVPFLVMELVEGETLAQLLRREGRLSQARALEILLPILSAVA